jgi:hypothetical protein
MNKEFIFIDEDEVMLGAEFVGGIRKHYNTGISAHCVAQLFKTNEQTVYHLWFPSGDILKDFNYFLKRIEKGLMPKATEVPAWSKWCKDIPRGSSDKFGEDFKKSLLKGLTEKEITENLKVSQSRIQKWKKALYGPASDPRRIKLEVDIEAARLARSIAIYQDQIAGLTMDELIAKHTLTEHSIRKRIAHAQKNYRKHMSKKKGENQ